MYTWTNTLYIIGKRWINIRKSLKFRANHFLVVLDRVKGVVVGVVVVVEDDLLDVVMGVVCFEEEDNDEACRRVRGCGCSTFSFAWSLLLLLPLSSSSPSTFACLEFSSRSTTNRLRVTRTRAFVDAGGAACLDALELPASRLDRT